MPYLKVYFLLFIHCSSAMPAGKRITLIFGDIKKPATLPAELNWANLSDLIRSRFTLEQTVNVSIQYRYTDPGSSEQTDYTIV